MPPGGSAAAEGGCGEWCVLGLSLHMPNKQLEELMSRLPCLHTL